MNYSELNVSSGIAVHIRPRTYQEWENQEDKRLEILAGVPAMVAAGKMQDVEMLLQRSYRQTRTERLAAWVKDFAKVKSKLTMRDIAEIETAAEALESVTVPEGNSETGGNGQ